MHSNGYRALSLGRRIDKRPPSYMWDEGLGGEVMKILNKPALAMFAVLAVIALIVG
jgi:hypothetical protein